MEEVSLAFDNNGKAHFIIAVDWAILDVKQVINQIKKLYDVYDVYDATHLQHQFFNAFYVTTETESQFKSFPYKEISIIQEMWKCKGVFLLKLSETEKFVNFLDKEGFDYIKRLVSLI